MRRMLMAGLMVLLAFGAPAVADAQPANPPGLAQIEAILAAYPGGGPGLQQAIAVAIERNPDWAAAVVLAAQTANVAQQQSLGLGLAEAVAVLDQSGTPAGMAAAEQIKQVVASAPPALLATFTIASSTIVSPVNGGSTSPPGVVANTGSSGLVTNNCISPSAPGNGCSP
jgi:hypothetical protein